MNPEQLLLHPPDEGTFSALYREHALGLTRLALLLVGDRQSAEDVVQEAYERFAKLFADTPGFVAATRPEDFPERLRVQAEPGSAPSIRADLSDLPGVDQVVADPSEPPCASAGDPACRD
jgi:hypothetical protein